MCTSTCAYPSKRLSSLRFWVLRQEWIRVISRYRLHVSLVLIRLRTALKIECSIYFHATPIPIHAIPPESFDSNSSHSNSFNSNSRMGAELNRSIPKGIGPSPALHTMKRCCSRVAFIRGSRWTYVSRSDILNLHLCFFGVVSSMVIWM